MYGSIKSSNVIIAGIAIFVAYRQYSVAKNKVKLDLYEKRYRVFQSAHEILDKILTGEELSDEIFSRFVQVRNESYFLFGKKLYKQIDEFYTVGFYYRYYMSLADGSVTELGEIDPGLIRLLEFNKTNIVLDRTYLKSLFHQYGKRHFWDLKDVFSEYLDFKRLY